MEPECRCDSYVSLITVCNNSCSLTGLCCNEHFDTPVVIAVVVVAHASLRHSDHRDRIHAPMRCKKRLKGHSMFNAISQFLVVLLCRAADIGGKLSSGKTIQYD